MLADKGNDENTCACLSPEILTAPVVFNHRYVREYRVSSLIHKTVHKESKGNQYFV